MKIPHLLPAILAGFVLTGTAWAGPASSVALVDDGNAYVLSNGIVSARVDKSSGDLVSLRFQDTEMLATVMGPDGLPDLEADPPGGNLRGGRNNFTDHQYGFWSHDAMGPRDSAPAIACVTIDPTTNGGDRAEVSVKGVSNGRKMGTGPGSGPAGDFVADVEIRWTLGRGDSGVYTYSVFEHRTDQPASSIAEARFCVKLNAFFDWMSISPRRDMAYPKDLHLGDKYIFTDVQFDNPAFGWSSTLRGFGCWILNPSVEYLSGGPTKVEFLGHRDTNQVAAPCILNYWRSSHYGGAEVSVAADEPWTKVVGPFLIYVNASGDAAALYTDARRQQAVEAQSWPYAWVAGVDYPHRAERATVGGRLVLADPFASEAKLANVHVGLTAPAYTSPNPAAQGRTVDWQIDAKHYEFWVRSNGGAFSIPNVRPGTYTLHAIADGVLGEFAQTNVVVEPGHALDLGTLSWKPVRRGQPLWEIGIPNRNAAEFSGAADYADPEISLHYAKLFPDDVTFVVGQSDFRKDWFFQHVPHNEDPDAKAMPYFGVRSAGRATPYTVVFALKSAPRGSATLRLAICGTSTETLDVTVNETPAGTIELGPGDGVITRHSIQGIWYERELRFDASLLKAGRNTLAIIVPAGPVNNGVVYDCLRLELDETAPAASSSP